MKNSKRRLSEYWDSRVLKVIPHNANYQKVEEEMKEHFGLIGTSVKRVVIPLVIFFVCLGLIFDMNVFGSLIISLIVFLYSNFVPDIDFLIAKTDRKIKESLWYEKYFWLFFAPIALYYVLIGRAKPVYSMNHRCFHNIKSIIIWGIFLFFIGNILWDERIKTLIMPLFGVIGYALHLIVDGAVFGGSFLRKKMERIEKV